MINMTLSKHRVQTQTQDRKSDGFNSLNLSAVKLAHPDETDTKYQI